MYRFILRSTKIVNVRRYIFESKLLTDAEKYIKELEIVDIQRSEGVALEIDAVNNETDDKSKQSK